MVLNTDRECRVVVSGEERHFVEGRYGQMCLLESFPGYRESYFLVLSPGRSLSLDGAPFDHEILVMEGSVEVGGRVWSSGAYLRLGKELGLPALSVRDEGACLFVKAGPFPEEDRRSVGIATSEAFWSPGLVEGLSVLPLFSGGGANTALVRWAPGTTFQAHHHFGGSGKFASVW